MQPVEPTAPVSEGTPAPLIQLALPGAPELRVPSHSGFAALAHEARNMLAALELYCELLHEPGVLAPDYRHYGSDLKMVAASSRRLVEKMGGLVAPLSPKANKQLVGECSDLPHETQEHAIPLNPSCPVPRWKELHELPIEDLAAELRTCQNLLIALAGSGITVTFDIRGCAIAVQMTAEDLTRILFNLVRNASEAMTAAGRIRISLRELPTEAGINRWALLTVEDNGPGIPHDALEEIFEPGYTTRGVGHEGSTPGPWPAIHRGLGLSITRSIVESAGGRIHAAVRDPSGTCFQVALPARSAF